MLDGNRNGLRCGFVNWGLGMIIKEGNYLLNKKLVLYGVKWYFDSRVLLGLNLLMDVVLVVKELDVVDVLMELGVRCWWVKCRIFLIIILFIIILFVVYLFKILIREILILGVIKNVIFVCWCVVVVFIEMYGVVY